MNNNLNKRQREELAKLYMDLGKLAVAGMVFGSFQLHTQPEILFLVGMVGLTFSIVFFIMGLKLFNDI